MYLVVKSTKSNMYDGPTFKSNRNGEHFDKKYSEFMLKNWWKYSEGETYKNDKLLLGSSLILWLDVKR